MKAPQARLYTSVAHSTHRLDFFSAPNERRQTLCGLIVPPFRRKRYGPETEVDCLQCQAETVARRAYWHGLFFERWGVTVEEYGAMRTADLADEGKGQGLYGRKQVR